MGQNQTRPRNRPEILGIMSKKSGYTAFFYVFKINWELYDNS